MFQQKNQKFFYQAIENLKKYDSKFLENNTIDTEISILEKSYKALQDTYNQDKHNLEEYAKEQEMKLRELNDEIADKDAALREAEHAQQQKDELIHRMSSIDSDMSSTGVGLTTDKERKLYEKYQNEKSKK